MVRVQEGDLEKKLMADSRALELLCLGDNKQGMAVRFHPR